MHNVNRQVLLKTLVVEFPLPSFIYWLGHHFPGGTKGVYNAAPTDSVRSCSFCGIPGGVGLYNLLFN